MVIKVLNENTSKRALRCEHGLSLYIETGAHRILFDTGQSDIFAENARKMGIDLSKIEMCIISHGHYDHGGGVPCFLEINDTAPVYIHQNASGSFYNESGKFIGLSKELFAHARIKQCSAITELVPNITLISSTCLQKKMAVDNFGLSMKIGDKLIPDDFKHEQYLLICENNQSCLFSGCSHNGIINIEKHFHPDYYIGGFHLSKLPADERLNAYADALNQYPSQYYTCHCTGEENFRYLQQRMPHLHYLSTGETLHL